MYPKKIKHIYGPVPSRRLGFSLGLDLVPYKVCSFDCVYCQLGKTTLHTIKRKAYIDYREIVQELKDVLKQGKKIDYITISGSGEPTLNIEIGELIRSIKKITSIPVAVLTNSSLFPDPVLRNQLLPSNLVVPSLDAVSPHIFRKINRPHSSVRINEIIDGLIKFRKIYKGKIWLEVMLVKGINDGLKEIKKIKEAVLRIKPDKIHLNLPVRPPQEKNIFPPSEKKLAQIKKIFGKKAEIIYLKKTGKKQKHITITEKEIYELIKRRPITLTDICNSLGLKKNEAIKYTQMLISDESVGMKFYRGQRYFIPK
ncbi:MAG: radical SAM protein [Elusimicrobiota bacterium]